MSYLLPNNNLLAVVEIELPDGEKANIGSGYLIMENNQHIFLVTAFHVLFDEKTGKPLSSHARLYLTEADKQEREILNIDLDQIVGTPFLEYNDEDDLVVIWLRDQRANLNPKFITMGIQELRNFITFDRSNLMFYVNVLPTMRVFIIGYPRSIGIEDYPQLNEFVPLVRSGIVAAKNEDFRTLILDCMINKGDSGGPVLTIDLYSEGKPKIKIIGTVIEYIPYNDDDRRNSGYSVAVCSDLTSRFIDEILSRLPQLYALV